MRNVRMDGVMCCDIWPRKGREGGGVRLCYGGKFVVLEWEVWRGVDVGGYIFLGRGGNDIVTWVMELLMSMCHA